MKKFTYVITDEAGIHARPAGTLIKMVKDLSSSVTLTKDGRTVDASRLMAVMSLGVKRGEEVTVAVEDDRDFETVKSFFEKNL